VYRRLKRQAPIKANTSTEKGIDLRSIGSFALSMIPPAVAKRARPRNASENEDGISGRSYSGPSEDSGTSKRASTDSRETDSGIAAHIPRGTRATGRNGFEEFPSVGCYHSIGTLDESVDLPAYVREHNATLTFPEKVSKIECGSSAANFSALLTRLFLQLMLTLIHVERECAKSGKKEEDASIGWILGGKAFVIRNKANLCNTWMPMFFGQAKFSSFTRKLYRWGFRKINMPHNSVVGASASSFFFGNENFQRDNKDLLTRMRSVTAAKTRSEQAAETARQTLMGSMHANHQAAAQGVETADLRLAQQPQSLVVGL